MDTECVKSQILYLLPKSGIPSGDITHQEVAIFAPRANPVTNRNISICCIQWALNWTYGMQR